MDCDTSYIGETGSDLQKQIVEHKAAVRRKDDKNGSAVHTNRHNHIEWTGWRRRTLEVIHMQKQRQTSNLDCGLALNAIRTPFLEC